MKICIDLGGGGGITPRDAQMLYYFMLGGVILIAILFTIFVAIPWLNGLVISSVCHFAPKWPVYGGCP